MVWVTKALPSLLLPVAMESLQPSLSNLHVIHLRKLFWIMITVQNLLQIVSYFKRRTIQTLYSWRGQHRSRWTIQWASHSSSFKSTLVPYFHLLFDFIYSLSSGQELRGIVYIVPNSVLEAVPNGDEDEIRFWSKFCFQYVIYFTVEEHMAEPEM